MVSEPVAVFDGQNYEFWAVRIQTTLMNKELWEIIKEGPPESLSKSPETPGADKSKEATDLKTLKAKDTAALQIIQYAVADTIFDKIFSATTAKQAWDLLEHSYQCNEKVKMVRLQSLRKEFENLKMKGEKFKAYSDRIQSVANQMRTLSGDRSNFDLVVKMLASIPKSYAGLTSLMEETKDLNSVTYAELIGSKKKKILDEEEENAEGAFHARFKNLKMENNDRGNISPNNYREKRWCEFCKRDTHNEEVCYFKNG
ncbi:uncharacterized protein LOC112081530 [Eutrema salsugineum]|uniref:uncharacterized protein LOC112081530 n=1 Tax=Eutrema salsugineum TaxID=72664 RepID=UPI000CED64AB|nr:uncharacterized protein LOC112081530 [Eutrema salsugineum]